MRVGSILCMGIVSNIKTADELWDDRASLKAKDALRKRNRNLGLMPSYVRNTDILDRYIQDNTRDDDLEEGQQMDLEMGDIMPRPCSSVSSALSISRLALK